MANIPDYMHAQENFSDEIQVYDIHTYHFQTNAASTAESFALREKLLKDFATDIDKGLIVVKKFHEQPIGPHPYAMWEADFKSPEIFSRLVPWFTLNHGSLSVLIHPHTAGGDQRKDHTQHALWLGEKVPLITSILPTGH